MDITNNEAQQLIDHYFQKMVVGLIGGISIGAVICMCVYKVGSYLLN